MFEIVVVEDDSYLRDELIHVFKKAGYLTYGITSFEHVEEDLYEMKPQLVVLDVSLPGKSGYELCKSLKARASFPILILTARDTLADELTALGIGADDFLTKPCHPDRLLARVERLLKTYNNLKGLLKVGSLSLDVDTYKLVFHDKYVVLAETEGKILQMLMERYPAVVGKGELFAAVWGTDEFVDENILQVNMSRLRKSLSQINLGNIILNKRGQGYVLKAAIPE